MLDFLAQFGYPILFLLNVLETAVVFGFILPADTLLVTSGILASMGIFDLRINILVSVVGAILGDNIAYHTGNRYGRKVLKKNGHFLGIKKKHFDYTKIFFQKHGDKSVLIGRFFGYVRSFVPLLAGINHMPYPKFLFFQINGAVIWAVFFNLIGFFFGQYWEVVHRKLKWVGLVMGGFLFLIVWFYFWWRRKKKLQQH